MPTIAILIDAENVSADVVPHIFKKLSQSHQIILKRAYGDFSKNQLQKWKEIAFKHHIETIHRFSCSKNSSDIMLAIDAMDMLYQQKIDTFCLFSSDSDFSSLVLRLKQTQKQVIGIGKQSANQNYKSLFDQFITIDEPAITQNKTVAIPNKKATDDELNDLRLAYQRAKKDNKGYVTQPHFASLISKETRTKYGKFKQFMEQCPYIEKVATNKKGEHKLRLKAEFC